MKREYPHSSYLPTLRSQETPKQRRGTEGALSAWGQHILKNLVPVHNLIFFPCIVCMCTDKLGNSQILPPTLPHPGHSHIPGNNSGTFTKAKPGVVVPSAVSCLEKWYNSPALGKDTKGPPGYPAKHTDTHFSETPLGTWALNNTQATQSVI